MSPIQSVRTCLQKFVDFSGRASRSELWWFVGFTLVVSALLSSIDAAVFGRSLLDEGYRLQYLSESWDLLMVLPTLSASKRRLNDTGRSSLFWMSFIVVFVVFLYALRIDELTGALGSFQDTTFFVTVFITFFVGLLAFLVFLLFPSQPGPNTYGPNPAEVTP